MGGSSRWWTIERSDSRGSHARGLSRRHQGLGRAAGRFRGDRSRRVLWAEVLARRPTRRLRRSRGATPLVLDQLDDVAGGGRSLGLAAAFEFLGTLPRALVGNVHACPAMGAYSPLPRLKCLDVQLVPVGAIESDSHDLTGRLFSARTATVPCRVVTPWPGRGFPWGSPPDRSPLHYTTAVGGAEQGQTAFWGPRVAASSGIPRFPWGRMMSRSFARPASKPRPNDPAAKPVP